MIRHLTGCQTHGQRPPAAITHGVKLGVQPALAYEREAHYGRLPEAWQATYFVSQVSRLAERRFASARLNMHAMRIAALHLSGAEPVSSQY